MTFLYKYFAVISNQLQYILWTDKENRPLYFWRVSGRCSYQVWKCAPAARYLIYGVGQQGKGVLT